MKLKSISIILVVATVASFGGAYLFSTYFDNPNVVVIESNDTTDYQNVSNSAISSSGIDFIEASKSTTPSVVFIKCESEYQRQSFWFFGYDPFGNVGKVASTGSGVILSEDGYIVTNYHVIKDADKIDVVLSEKNKTYRAELIGSDPSTDLALLKVETENLTPIQFGNSDDVQIGQWVLAVGNPFNLTSTVTAGIVSAKGRNINIVNNQFPIESFIQTDAAINPGNSGGALVDLNGKLIGVNTAIASKTGSYIGYGFAIPGNIVAKTIDDLKEFGEVQRAFLGVEVIDIDGDLQEKLGAENGVLIQKVRGTNSFAEGKLEAGDVVTKLDGKPVMTKALFDELLAYKRPGESVNVEILRDGKIKNADITLVNKEGTTELIKRVSYKSEVLGGEFEPVSKMEKQALKILTGYKISNIGSGRLRQMNLPEGYIIVNVNNKSFKTANELIDYLETVLGQVRIEGVHPNGQRQYATYYFR